ncbi:MAG: transglutaminase-like domain-containing protein [Bacteroidales bacterium]|nr:transglutaminase-like domain-containing protein [Bacteroidales bacterium]
MNSLKKNYYFIPLNKYDTVQELPDGSIVVPPHVKQRYLFACEDDGKVYILNNMNGSLFTYLFNSQEVHYIFTFAPEFLKNQIYFTKRNHLYYFFDINNIFRIFDDKGQLFSELPYATPWQAFCFDEKGNFIVLENWNVKVWIMNKGEFQLYKTFSIDGIGHTSLLAKDGSIFITDSEENILRAYSYDGVLKLEAITPHIDPIGQVILEDKHYILYGGLWNEVSYENRCWQEQKPFFHRIYIHEETVQSYKLVSTNSFLIDFYYEEHIKYPENVDHFPWVIRMKLPQDDHHQKILDVKPLGLPYRIVNDHFAEFIINSKEELPPAFGFKATIELKSVKFIPCVPVKLSQEIKLSLHEIEELDADCEYFNFFKVNEDEHLEKVNLIREKIFKKISYKINRNACNFKEVWEQGYGTCGDYTSLLLIGLYKNNISAQSATGYKVHRFYFGHQITQSVYYNHTWIETFDQNNFHLPIETSSDDKEVNHRFSKGQFLGLDWTHVKLYSGKVYPNFIWFPSHPTLHPFDVFGHPLVFITILDEE